MKKPTNLDIGRSVVLLIGLVMSCVSLRADVSFLDQKKTLKPAQEWNREVVCKTNGTMLFKITSEGPFSVSILSDKAYKALLKRDMETFKKEGFVLTTDSKEKALERSLQLKNGSYWFIIRNNLQRDTEVRLECFAVQNSRDTAKPKD
jgi:hypothetical protein